MTRLDRLGATLSRPLLVMTPSNVVYLTGFHSSNCALLVQPGGDTTLYTDFRYADSARSVEGVTFQQTRRDLVGALAELHSGSEIEIEAANVTVARHDVLLGGGVRTVAGGGQVERLRAVKDEAELAAIRKACAISDRVYAAARRLSSCRAAPSGRLRGGSSGVCVRKAPRRSRLRRSSPPGRTGRSRTRIRRSGSSAAASSSPSTWGASSTATARTARARSRPAPLTGELAEIYALCEAAQLDGLAAVRAGASGKDVDAASRTRIEAAGRADQYGHGLGHGVGLDVHEAPTLRPESTDTLEAGNVVSVEPGIYVPGRRRRPDRGSRRRHRGGLRGAHALHEGASSKSAEPAAHSSRGGS